jgi:hypothetical protein
VRGSTPSHVQHASPLSLFCTIRPHCSVPNCNPTFSSFSTRCSVSRGIARQTPCVYARQRLDASLCCSNNRDTCSIFKILAHLAVFGRTSERFFVAVLMSSEAPASAASVKASVFTPQDICDMCYAVTEIIQSSSQNSGVSIPLVTLGKALRVRDSRSMPKLLTPVF